MWKGNLCGGSVFVHYSGPSEQCTFPKHSVSLFSCQEKKCLSEKALIVLSASHKKEFSKKILNGGSLGSHVDEGRSKMRELV